MSGLKDIKTLPTQTALKKPSSKSSCTGVDHSAKTGAIVYDQGKSGTCYAYAAAQIMSYDPKLEKGPEANAWERISPLATSIQNAQMTGGKSKITEAGKRGDSNTKDLAMNGGLISFAIEAANAFGPCSEELWGGKNELESDNAYDELIDLYNKYVASKSANSSECTPAEAQLLESSFNMFTQEYLKFIAPVVVAKDKKATPEEVKEALKVKF